MCTYTNLKLSNIKSAISRYEDVSTVYINECKEYAEKNHIIGEIDITKDEGLQFWNQCVQLSYQKIIDAAKELIEANNVY